ncbi:MAG: PA14 domain-containing protein [Candidatus Woykebacteria bacterium]
MRAADLFRQSSFGRFFKTYRKSINPPYRRKDLVSIGATVFILLVIPLTVIAVYQARQLLSQAATTSPYPSSSVITGFNFDTASYNSQGDGDCWPATWAADGDQYIFGNDATGFQGGSNHSLSFHKIIGNTGASGAWSGQDINSSIEEPGPNGSCGRKASGLIQVDGKFYVAVRNADGNCSGTGSILAESTNGGTNWTYASWKFSEFGYLLFMNMGQNYNKAKDNYVYLYSPDERSAYKVANNLALMRVPKDQIMNRGSYEFFKGLDGSGNPTWTSDINQRQSAMTFNQRVYRPGAVYNPALDRFMMVFNIRSNAEGCTDCGGVNGLHVLDAPNPWGPWTTVYSNDNWGDQFSGSLANATSSPFHPNFAPKWISSDGKTMYLHWSCHPNCTYKFNVMKITLETSGGTTPPAGNINVDFTNTIRTLSPLTFGMDISGYGQGFYITNDATHRSRLTDLDLGHIRMDLKYATAGNPNSAIQCGGAGCATSVSGDSWVNSIKSTGAEPVVIVPMYQGNASLSASDAANMVKHFNVNTNNTVKRWILYNEPDGVGMSASEYTSQFNQMYDAMKAVDPTIKIGGPATAWFNTAFLQTFLNGSGSRVDFIDFHKYGQGGTATKTEAQLLTDTVEYENNINQLRTMLQNTVPARASQIEIQIGEWNLDWDGDPKHYENFNTVWSASSIGRMIKAGGYPLQYADKNGGLGAIFETDNAQYGKSRNDPMPVYHAIGMYTGENLFRHFGNQLVSASTTLSNVEVYASNNQKNIVVVNKNPSTSQTATFSLTGVTSAPADVWRKDGSFSQFDAPKKIGTTNVSGGQFSYTLPAYSVTTFVIDPSSGPTPDPAPTVDIKANGSNGPITVQSGSDVTLSWISTDATSCTAADDWSGSKATSGSQTISNVTSNKKFTLSCTGSGGSASDNVVVNVSEPTPDGSFLGEYWDNFGSGSTSTSCCSSLQFPTSSPTFTRSDANVNFDWGLGSPTGSIGADTFMARWTKTEDISQAGNYTFTLRSDDGSRLYIDGNLLIDAWYNQSGATTHTATVFLSSGDHDIKIEYYENTFDAKIFYSMSFDGDPTPTKPGDINGDGLVNIFDASILSSRWGTNDPDADLNGNGIVDIFDASILAANWDD